MTQPKVFVIILNWNKPFDTAECVRSCQEINYSNFEILVVDNHSSDSSVQILKAEFTQLKILENKENFGYAGGNNAGIREALREGAEYVLILNNDVVVDRDILKELIKAAQLYANAGILAPKILSYEDRTKINSAGTSMDWFRLRPFLGAYGKKDLVSDGIWQKQILVGCALMISKHTLQKISYLDEKFFLIHEDADWCFKSLSHGFVNLTVESAKVYHKESKTLRDFPSLTHYYSIRNFLLLAKRYAKGLNRVLVALGLCYLILKNIRYKIVGDVKEKKEARAFFAGISDYFAGRFGKCQRIFS